jgi:mono/diheme cytochrome c family protein
MLLPQIGFTGQGDPAIGKALFVGSTPFANGGAPCLGCHAIAGIGSAGAANFGPDLTALYEENEAEGVAEIMSG